MSHFQYIIPRKTKQGEMFQLMVTQKVDKLFILSATEREKLTKSFFSHSFEVPKDIPNEVDSVSRSSSNKNSTMKTEFFEINFYKNVYGIMLRTS